MKKADKVIDRIKKMIDEANKKASYCKGVDYDEGFYVGRGEALEDVLEILNENE